MPFLNRTGLEHIGLALGTWVFHWASLFLGPGEWACEPYFSNPISCPLTLVYGICG